jgi:hypothetical protein
MAWPVLGGLVSKDVVGQLPCSSVPPTLNSLYRRTLDYRYSTHIVSTILRSIALDVSNVILLAGCVQRALLPIASSLDV